MVAQVWGPDAKPTRPLQVVSVCRRCGHVNGYDLPPVGRPFPSVRCNACNQVAQRLGRVTRECRRRAERLEVAPERRQLRHIPLRANSRRSNSLTTYMDMSEDKCVEEVGRLHAQRLRVSIPAHRQVAAMNDIAVLPMHTIKGDEACCAVCLQEFLDSDKLKTLPCMHRYHANCVDKWLLKHNSCPVCKRPTGWELPCSTHCNHGSNK